jgi:hypothetical protein
LNREELNDPLFKENMDIVRRIAPRVMSTVNAVTMELIQMFNQQHSVKKITTKNVMYGLKFKQYFTQGLFEKMSELLQLPHFDADVLKKLSLKRA